MSFVSIQPTDPTLQEATLSFVQSLQEQLARAEFTKTVTAETIKDRHTHAQIKAHGSKNLKSHDTKTSTHLGARITRLKPRS